MNLVNIHTEGKDVYLFLRDQCGNLKIEKHNDFFPYYYDQCAEGNCLGYGGERLKKLFLSDPREIVQRRSDTSYESDILFAKRFIIDKVNEIAPTKLRWAMVDMETLSKTVPKPLETKHSNDPISCIVLYDNFTDQYYTWYLGDYKREEDLWDDFCSHVKANPPDLVIAHNMNQFDYPYWFYRIKDFAKKISPIGQCRYGPNEMRLPAGISIVDSLEWWKKYTLNKEESYALEALMEKYLGYDKGKYKNIDFSQLNSDIVGRCQGDVKGMVELERKMQMIPHFDMIRRISHIEWEDMNWNSRIIDMFLLREAKKGNVALPAKPKGDEVESDDFEGAFREAFETGAFYGIGKYDLSGAYCYAIIDLCLDSINIVNSTGKDVIDIDVKDRLTQKVVETYSVKQNQDALLPKVVKKLVNAKNELKALKNQTDPSSPEYKEIERKYDAFKTIVLSAWGVIGNKYFRLYDKRVASMTTGIVRDLLHYIFDELERRGYKVIYIDTDSTFIQDNGENLEPLLNDLINQWALDRFGKKVSIQFDYEGHFTKLLILAKCRYIGYLDTGHGIKKEVKGVEAKRKDSSVFMKKFQETLIDKILDKETKESIYGWIFSQMEDIKQIALIDIAFPCRLSKKPSKYCTYTKPLQALDNTPEFSKDVGERFYYIFVKPEYYVEEKEVTEYYREVPGKRPGTTKKERLKKAEINVYSDINEAVNSGEVKVNQRIQKIKKARDVMAFDEDNINVLKELDWSQIIRRNITLKLDTIFRAMGWEKDLEKFDA